jgi:small subunit ribosomal protein S24e
LEIKILDERPNPLLKRTDYRFEVDHATAATPSRDVVRSEFAKIVKAPKDRIIIERMNARYGTAKSLGEAALYESVDAAKAVVREHILVRNGLKEKSVKGPTPAAESAPEPPPAKAEASETPKEPSKAARGEPSKEATKEPAAEHPKEAAKETHKEPVKEAHKESARESHKESSKEAHKGSGKESHKEPSKSVSKES